MALVIRSYHEALRIARAAGADAANRRMRKARRQRWTRADYNHGANVTIRILAQLGYDSPLKCVWSPELAETACYSN
jgi:hypothetical protein